MKESFNSLDAVTIYMVSMIHFIHGFTHLRDIHKYYEMSILSVHCSSIRLGYDALTKLFDALGRNLNTCKTAVHSLEVKDRFIYQKDKKASVVGYKDEIIDVYCVLTYRDLNESAAEQENYLRHMECGDKAYTKESFEKANYYLGVTVLQTSLEDKSLKEIYELYKECWRMESSMTILKTKPDTIHFMRRIITNIITCLPEVRMIKSHKSYGK